MLRRNLWILITVSVALIFFLWNSNNNNNRRSLKLLFASERPNVPGVPAKCNIFKPESVPDDFVKANLIYSKGTAVCFVHGTFDLVSNSIIQYGGWENGYIAEMEKIFDRDPSLGLIDIGCNLGVYTITAAMRQRKVVSVDMNIANLKRLRKSLLANKVAQNVTLVYNGISDRHQEFSMKTPTRSNIGDTFMVTVKPGDSKNLVKSILINDLLEVIDFKRAILKIDIQGHEYEGFQHAEKLFTQIDIPLVLMEWEITRGSKNKAMYFINFFKNFNYKAYASISATIPLNESNPTKWPWDIVWKKKSP